jgi:biopolymer transport protein TolQ
MVAHASVLGYFWQAGIVVKSVMLILLAASVTSWTLIFQRAWYFKQAKLQYQKFHHRFWQSRDLTDLYERMDKQDNQPFGLASIFYSGFKEFLRLRKQGGVEIEPIQRLMQISHAKEAEHLEQHLPFFASVGSIAPYIGLFGTVWGIMTSFQALGQASQATIAMVAPGISEALVATALGLFTAIPAVIAFNRYTTASNDLLNRYELFQEELISLISQQTTIPPQVRGLNNA